MDVVLFKKPWKKRGEGTLPDVEVEILVSPDSPWSSASSVLEECRCARIYRVYLADASQDRLWKAFLPVFEVDEEDVPLPEDD